MGVTWIDPFKFVDSDPNFSSVVSLLHFEGTNGSTTITDQKPHTWTVSGNAQISTGTFRFGAASLALDGAGDFLNGDGSADFSFGTGDFTVEFFVNFSGLTGTVYPIDFRNATAYPAIGIQRQTTTNFFSLFSYDGSSSAVRITGTTAATTGVWYHVAVSRASGTTRLFVNGTQEGSNYTDSTNYSIGASRPYIGAINGGSTNYVNGFIDELRITKGVGRYTSNFTAPTKAFPDQ